MAKLDVDGVEVDFREVLRHLATDLGAVGLFCIEFRFEAVNEKEEELTCQTHFLFDDAEIDHVEALKGLVHTLGECLAEAKRDLEQAEALAKRVEAGHKPD